MAVGLVLSLPTFFSRRRNIISSCAAVSQNGSYYRQAIQYVVYHLPAITAILFYWIRMKVVQKPTCLTYTVPMVRPIQLVSCWTCPRYDKHTHGGLWTFCPFTGHFAPKPFCPLGVSPPSVNFLPPLVSGNFCNVTPLVESHV